MSIFVIYKNPSDYPNEFVVRVWVVAGIVVPLQRPLVVVDTIEQARAAMPDGLFKMDRQDDDDPCIVEAWM